MVVPLSDWPIYTDDTGTKTDGTPLDEDFFDAILLAISHELHGTDPSPAAHISDYVTEIIQGRGGQANLDARFDAIEGSLSGGASASLAQLQSQVGAHNIAKNYDLSRWAAGAAAAPDDWTLTGAGASSTRTGNGEVDTFSFLAGKYTVKLASGGAANAVLTQTVLSDWTEHGNARGRNFAATCKCSASSGVAATLTVDDGVNSTVATHPQDGIEHDLVVVHAVNAGATSLTVKITVPLGTKQAYFGGFQFVWSDKAPSDWSPASGEATVTTPGIVSTTTQEIGGSKKFAAAMQYRPGGSSTYDAQVVGKLTTDFGSIGNSGVGLTDLKSYSLPANVLNADQRGLIIRAAGTFAANANNKSINLVFGATTVNLLVTAAHNGGSWMVEAWLGRTGAATEILYVNFSRTTAAGVFNGVTFVATPAAATSGAITIKMQGQSGTGSNDVIQNFWYIEQF